MGKDWCKKTLIFFVVALLVVASCTFVQPVQAVSNEPYYLQSIVNDNKFVGARMYGNYFANDNLTNVDGIYMAMGVPVSVEIYTSDKLPIDSKLDFSQQNPTIAQLKEIFARINDIIVEIDNLTNPMYNGQNGLPQSDVFKYNNATTGQEVEISSDTYTMLQLAQQCYLQTDGLFNPCAYRLVDLWGFSSRVFTYSLTTGCYAQPYDRAFVEGGGYQLPTDNYVQAFSDEQFVSFAPTSVVLEERNSKFYVTKNVNPAVVEQDGITHTYHQWLDLGGVAKGYVADLVAQFLESMGLTNYYISVGDSSVRMGKFLQDKEHLIVQQDAFNPAYSALGYNFTDVGLACSGKYLRNYMVDGVVYNHIINPKTGGPSNGVVEGVLVATDGHNYTATITDCYATALSIMDEQQVVDYINNNPTVLVSALCKNVKGQQIILSNLDKNSVYTNKTTFDSYAWALEKSNGQLVINENAVAPSSRNIGPIIAIVVGCVIIVAAVVIVLLHFVKKRKNILVAQARKSSPFMRADITLYFILVLAVVLLLVGVMPEQTAVVQVEIHDMQTDQLLFVYNVNKDSIYTNEQNGWTVTTERQNNLLTVTIAKEIDGQTHFNKIQIDISNNTSVQMVSSLCGRHQECVKTFHPITMGGGTIVCSPNSIKVVTK